MGISDKTKMHVGGALFGVAMIAILALAVPTSHAWVIHSNESSKDLEDDVPVLDTDLTAGNYTVTYTYQDVEDEKRVVVITQDPTVGASAETFNSELRVLGIDFAGTGINITKEPEYKKTADFDHFVTFEFEEQANILWDDSVRSWCLGFALTRGDTAATVTEQDYKIEVGAGDAVFYTTTVAPEEDTGDADTNDVGTCQGRSDPSDTDPEFGAKIEITDIQSFLTESYVADDPKKPEDFYIKVYGPRADVAAINANSTEAGDAFDVAFQVYTWGASKTEYDDLSVMTIGWGVGALGAAIVMLAAFSLPWNTLKSNRTRVTAPGARSRRGVM